MKLQAEDLMVGDWVKVKYTQKQVKVKEIKQSCIYTEGNGYEYDEIEFIPLIAEILEKNGFINKKDKWMQLGNFGNQPLMMWHLKDNSIMSDYKHQMEIHYSAKKCHLTVMCEYVHQFQHALKLCGIEKEIEL